MVAKSLPIFSWLSAQLLLSVALSARGSFCYLPQLTGRRFTPPSSYSKDCKDSPNWIFRKFLGMHSPQLWYPLLLLDSWSCNSAWIMALLSFVSAYPHCWKGLVPRDCLLVHRLWPKAVPCLFWSSWRSTLHFTTLNSTADDRRSCSWSDLMYSPTDVKLESIANI